MAWESITMILNRALIVRVLSISLCFVLGVFFCQASTTEDAINSYKELQSRFNGDKNKFSEVHPEPAFLTSPEHMQSPPFATSRPVNEEIALNVTNSKKQVQDIEAINTIKQRTIVYDDVQRSNGVNEDNSLHIEIAGNGQEQQSMMDLGDDFGNAIEEKVDFAFASSVNHKSIDKTGPIQGQVNNLNIDVSGISVRAINTVPGGTAIATSNIQIEPVQIIVQPSEASEKLR
jgi:hypothetical protein